MVGSYDAYEPLNTLDEIGPDIWIVDGPVLQWGYGIPVKWPFPTRMTIIRLPDGGLWLHSPTRPDEKLLENVRALGPVRHIVSPNMIHHVSIKAWAARFQDAKVWASPGVRARSDVAFTDDLADTPPADWGTTIDQRIARGSKVLEEAIFFHKPSKVLILTDLIENFEDERLHGWLARIMYRLIGVMAPHGRAPRDLRATFAGHHDKLAPVVNWMIDCAPEKVVIAHGKWFEKDGTGQIRRAFSWVQGAKV
ncbi:DUF4336 domain-containing protein [Oricola sp.]|uniref:DUF4336 domain-containing protein n=1 Tax=Oricola sp. TaxID=1979950 RepID=UPI0025EA7C6A|nr:DUF4336 domain-containing protein [Oricola sp.]MCI5075424.1 DUF4336 domain-containing protein [Oricola sp.]